jgi:hypothetical protein
VRRPLSALAALGTAAHHGFELRAGVGIVFEPFLGRRLAVALWSAVLANWLASARTGRHPRLLAHGNGAALGGALVHFVLWPWELRRGIPALTEAEGLTADQLPAYNAVLRCWIAAAALALAFETPRDGRAAAFSGMLMGEPLRRSARHHFRWAREQARREPGRWSPALRLSAAGAAR